MFLRSIQNFFSNGTRKNKEVHAVEPKKSTDDPIVKERSPKHTRRKRSNSLRRRAIVQSYANKMNYKVLVEKLETPKEK